MYEGVEVLSIKREMPVVLWVSRHPILPAESEELHRIFREFVFLEYREPVEVRKDSDFLELVRNVRPDVIVAVVPLSVMAKLLEIREEYGFELWRPTMEEVRVSDLPDHDEECEVAMPLKGGQYKIYRFKHFSRVREIKVVEEPIGVTE